MEKEQRIDLTKIEEDGEFPCPTCGDIISPDDESEVAYSILEIEKEEDGIVKEILMQFKKCGSMIRLGGFDSLGNIDCSDSSLVLRCVLDAR